MSAKTDKRIQSIGSLETYAYGASRYLVCKNEETECNNIFDDVTKENIKNWPQFPDHPNRIVITGGSASGKTKALFNLISYRPDIDKIYLRVKDPYEIIYQLLINKRESTS